MKTKYIIVLIIALVSSSIKAQITNSTVVNKNDSTVSLDEAMRIALSNNYDLKIATNQLKQAQNSNSIGNAGLLPSVSLNGSAQYSKQNTKLEFGGGGNMPSGPNTVDGAVSKVYNANVRVDYILFNGLGNIYTLKKLRGSNKLQQTVLKQKMEATILEVANNYYNVCRAQDNLNLATENMNVSRDRYKRIIDLKSYGQATQLDALNAQVDLNNDSTNVLNIEQQLVMSVKNLNLSLGIPIQQIYQVNDAFELKYDKSAAYVINTAMVNNNSLITQQQQENIKDVDFKITRSKKYPTLSAFGEYGYNKQNSDAGIMKVNQTSGLTSGISLKMNVFNGRSQHTREENAKLSLMSEQERTKQIKAQIERDASNAYTDYSYKVKIVNLQKSSVEQAKRNFEQTKEMFKLGRVNSLAFRTAQQNLLHVANNYNDARFNAKVAEFYLLKITGDLVKDNKEK